MSDSNRDRVRTVLGILIVLVVGYGLIWGSTKPNTTQTIAYNDVQQSQITAVQPTSTPTCNESGCYSWNTITSQWDYIGSELEVGQQTNGVQTYSESQPVTNQTSENVPSGMTETEVVLVVIVAGMFMYLVASVMFAKMGAGKLSPVLLAIPYIAAIFVVNPLLVFGLVVGPFVLIFVGFVLMIKNGYSGGSSEEELTIETPQGKITAIRKRRGLIGRSEPLMTTGDANKLIGPGSQQSSTQIEAPQQRRQLGRGR